MSTVTLNKLILVGLIAAALAGGAYMGHTYTKQHYEAKIDAELTKEQETDQKNLICEARVQRGKTGDVKSEYFIFERSAKEEDCKKYIDYKNIPDDTESFWMGF